MLKLIFVVALGVSSVRSAGPNDVSTGIGYFSNSLYQQCAATSTGNMVISPYSIVSALALLFQGAEGATYQQMRSVLNLNVDKDYTANYFQRAFGTLRYTTGQSTLNLVNSIYIHKNYKLKQRFLDVATRRLYAEVKPSDFSWPDRLTETINRDVNAKTNGNIRNLIPIGSIAPTARLIVVNTLYFRERWKYQFDAGKLTPFWTNNRYSVAIPFMHVTETFKYGELSGMDARALKLPYVTPGVSFVIVLPNRRDGLPSLQRQLVNFDLSAIDGQLIEQKVIVQIPKFRFDFQIELRNVLEQMGMSELFSRTANFNGILEVSEPLQVSRIFHKTMIDVNEKGTVASSATGAIIVNRSGFAEDVKTFFADHPFFFAIISETSGKNTILFSGHYQGR